MRKLGHILLFSLLLAVAGQVSAQPQLDSARKYLYVREAKPNRSPEIDTWNRFTKARLGSPYCASFVSYMIREQTTLKNALATRLITKQSITAQQALRGVPVPPGSIVIWRKGDTYRGHAGLVISWHKSKGKTIEANTSSGEAGSQSDGDGVYIRQRKISPYSNFRIVAFTPIGE